MTTPEESGVSPKTQPGVIALRLEAIQQELHELRHQAKEHSYFAQLAISNAGQELARAVYELVGNEPAIKARFTPILLAGAWLVMDAQGVPIVSRNGEPLTRESAHAIAEERNRAIEELAEAAGRG